MYQNSLYQQQAICRKEGVACEEAPSSMYHERGEKYSGGGKYSTKSYQLLVRLLPTINPGTSNE